MKLLTERQQILNLQEDLKHDYWMRESGKADEVIAELGKLDLNTASAQDVLDATGLRWVCERECNECGKVGWDVVQLGEEPDYESATACVCGDCLRAALKLLSDHPTSPEPPTAPPDTPHASGDTPPPR